MSAIAATAVLPQGMTAESIIALAIKALVRLVTEPEVPHETVRRAADSLLRYAAPKPEPKAGKPAPNVPAPATPEPRTQANRPPQPAAPAPAARSAPASPTLSSTSPPLPDRAAGASTRSDAKHNP